MSAMTTVETAQRIEITQDHEFDEDFGVGNLLNVFWTEGHGHDPEGFIRAVIDHCLEMTGGVPRIDEDDAPVEMWQHNVQCQDGIEYRRSSERGSPRDLWKPITLFDLERGSRGGTKCGVDKCDKPWQRGPGAIIRVEPDADGDSMPSRPYMTVRMWFCREHSRQFPQPMYRVCMVPVGATIMLPENSDA